MIFEARVWREMTTEELQQLQRAMYDHIGRTTLRVIYMGKVLCIGPAINLSKECIIEMSRKIPGGFVGLITWPEGTFDVDRLL